MPSDYSKTYYERNREWILQKMREKHANKENAEKILQYQQNYFKEKIEAKKAYNATYRKEHLEEIMVKRRETYRNSVLEESGRVVVPTAKKLDATGIQARTQKRIATLGNIMHKRHLIDRRLEINQLRAEAFKKILSGETICPTNNESEKEETTEK
jgi:hypothetical protein